MKKSLRYISLAAALILTASFVSCEKAEIIAPTYTMTVEATKGEGTKALSLEYTTITSTWTENDPVEVWTSDGTTTKYGTLTAQSSGATTQLAGTLDTPPANGETLLLKYLSPNYNAQDGNLTGTANSIDKVCDYATATVTATVSGTTITTSEANFASQQAIVRFVLTRTNGNSMSPTVFVIQVGGITYTVISPDVLPAVDVAFPGFSDQTIELFAKEGNNWQSFKRDHVSFDNGYYYFVQVRMQDFDKLPGAFSVGASSKVRFSKGNLKYNGSAYAWDFHEHQYDMVNTGNGTQSSYPLDLFTWGNTEYPATPAYNGKTYLGGEEDLSTDSYKKTDWGYNMGRNWYTMSKDQWQYLLNTRTGASEKHGSATVCGVHGLILLPDSWTLPAGLAFNSEATEWETNNYDAAQWTRMEAAGAVFLPAAGSRAEGDGVLSVGDAGAYWTSTHQLYTDYRAYRLLFSKSNLETDYTARSLGFAVRLVKDVN